MNKTNTRIAGERTQDISSEQQSHNLGSERGGYLHNGKTAEEWFNLYEELRLDYGRAIKELEGQDTTIRKLKEADADKLRKTSPQGVKG